MANKAKKWVITEKMAIVIIALFATGMTFGFPWSNAKQANTQNLTKPKALAANIYVTTEIDFNVDAPFKQKTIYNNKLPKGTSIVTTKGVNGKKTVTYRVVHQDDIITARDVVNEEITQQPIDQVTTVGTYIKPTNSQKVLGSNISGSPNTDPDPTPTQVLPTPTCPDGYFYSTTYSHCVPNGKTGMCNSGSYTTATTKSLACTKSGIKEWYLTT